MKIVRIELHDVRIPLPAVFQPSWIPGFPQTENRFTLCRLETASGLVGWSAGAAVGGERAGVGELLGPYLLGERADDLASIRQRIREMGYLGIRMGWIEPACWDIVGKARGVPVYELLGGRGGTIRLYASTGEVRSGVERGAEVLARRDEGFDAVKLRVHAPTLKEDLAQIRTTRELVGDDLVLGVDANQGWRVAAIRDAPLWDLDRARSFCREAGELGYSWVEEPLAMDAYDDLARLRDSVAVDVAGGELNGGGEAEFRILLEKGAFDLYQPDATFTGGIAETWRIIRQIEAAGARYTPHSWTNGIGFAINLQLFAASPWREETRFEYPYDPPGWVPSARDGLLTEPWSHRGGKLRLPTRPGLGFEIDPRALRRHGSRFFCATKVRTAIRTIWDRGLGTALTIGRERQARLDARHEELEERIEAGEDIVRAEVERPVATEPTRLDNET